MFHVPLKLSVKAFRKLIVRYKSTVIFPTVRRIYPQALAQSIVSVQPMALPSGLTFYLDYSYGTKTSGSQDSNDKERSKEGDCLVPEKSETNQKDSTNEEAASGACETGNIKTTGINRNGK